MAERYRLSTTLERTSQADSGFSAVLARDSFSLNSSVDESARWVVEASTSGTNIDLSEFDTIEAAYIHNQDATNSLTVRWRHLLETQTHAPSTLFYNATVDPDRLTDLFTSGSFTNWRSGDRIRFVNTTVSSMPENEEIVLGRKESDNAFQLARNIGGSNQTETGTATTERYSSNETIIAPNQVLRLGSVHTFGDIQLLASAGTVSALVHLWGS